MKFTQSAIIVSFALLCSTSADDQEKKAEPSVFDIAAKIEADEIEEKKKPTDIGLLFEWIELDHRQANKLIRKHATQLDSNKLREILETMLDEEKAELVETAYYISRNGVRSMTESVDEHIYPTEYDPPETPQKIPKDIPLDQIPITPANPTAFDVRNVGTTVETEAVINHADSTIAISLAPEIVRHVGDRTIGDPKTLHAALAHVYQPDFYVMRLATDLVLQDGDHTLVSLFTPAGKKDKRVMLIVRAKILK